MFLLSGWRAAPTMVYLSLIALSMSTFICLKFNLPQTKENVAKKAGLLLVSIASNATKKGI